MQRLIDDRRRIHSTMQKESFLLLVSTPQRRVQPGEKTPDIPVENFMRWGPKKKKERTSST